MYSNSANKVQPYETQKNIGSRIVGNRIRVAINYTQRSDESDEIEIIRSGTERFAECKLVRLGWDHEIKSSAEAEPNRLGPLELKIYEGGLKPELTDSLDGDKRECNEDGHRKK